MATHRASVWRHGDPRMRGDRGAADSISRCRTRDDADKSARRSSCRYTVLDHRGWLGQWSDRDFTVMEVCLLDISRGGVAFEMNVLPAENQTALLGLQTLREAWCLE